MSSSPDITQLLMDWSNGDRSAFDRLMPLVYEELRRRAHYYMRNEHPGHVLQTTALVNEAYIRLVDQKGVGFRTRAHFFAIAARVMRQILVDHARNENRVKRGRGVRKVPIEDAAGVASGAPVDWLVLDEAISKLAAVDPRASQVFEMRYFGGLTFDEVSEVLDIAPTTVRRDSKAAEAFLRRELELSQEKDAKS